MAHFIKIDHLDGESSKINLDLVLNVELYKGNDGRKRVSVYYTDGTNTTFIDGITVENIESVYNKFPC